MVKFLTVFNLLAGAASFAGLFLSLAGNGARAWLIGVFALAGAISLYVLLVPESRVERNVRAKFERYRNPRDGSLILIQRGTFTISGLNSVGVEFDTPFAEPPAVEVINDLGHNGLEPQIWEITPYKVVFRRDSFIAPGEKQRFSWVARGVELQRL